MAKAGCVISIGNFDGVHIGHHAILARARQMARHHGVGVTAITFDPSPMRILNPQAASPRLSDIHERVRLLRQAGADEVVVIEPTKEFLAQEAQSFLMQLVHQRHPAAFVEGANFRFGKGRGGDVSVLAAQVGTMGFVMEVVPAVELAFGDLIAGPVSSTLVRYFLDMGRVWEASQCLGRSYELAAKVVAGDQRGRTLGVPTVNLDDAMLTDRMIPAEGVYAGRVILEDGTIRLAAISIGSKPTFGGTQRLAEAHLLDFSGDLYGRTVRVQFDRWLRHQQAFPDVPALKTQLKRDIQQIRTWAGQGVLAAAGVSQVR